MARTIIGIHGLANKPSSQTLAAWWETAIREGLEKNRGRANAEFEFRMVHWADLLYKYSLHDDAAFNFDPLYNKQPFAPAPDGALQYYRENWFDRLREEGELVLGRGLDALEDRLGVQRIAQGLVDLKLRDLAYYWDEGRKIRDRTDQVRSARDVLDDECTRALRSSKGTDICLIAHSMGSIIAYNSLRHLGRLDEGIPVSHFVTIGSPLGLTAVKVRTRTERWDGQVRTPSIVTGRWVNFSDRRDPVAADSHLSDDYGKNESGIVVEDDLVLNDFEAGGEPNPHKSYGYLRTPEMSDVLDEFLSA